MRHEIKGFTNEELNALAEKGISPNPEYHLQAFIRSLAENIGGQFKKRYWPEGETRYAEHDGP